MRNDRGLTLVEVTVGMVLASIVLVGLVGFYLSSQSAWVESSTKVVTQREATLAVEEMSARIRASSVAIAQPTPDPQHMTLYLYDFGGSTPAWRFWWEPSDSLLHHGPGSSTDLGALAVPRATRFQASVNGGLVDLALDLVSASGDSIAMTSAAALYNRP